ncbi:hypothetical protein SFRURICE_016571 [Spodoptera frugiperda]|nr:hypothetical protein SFRURICE_016571 [Spodoptera frugiperda]
MSMVGTDCLPSVRYYLLQRHAFYPRRSRQRCTLQHIMPIYNVYPLFTICVITPINALPDPRVELKTSCPADALATTRPTSQVLFIISSITFSLNSITQ